ncbi:MAG: hypothetical protein WCT85_02490 [Parachlamydiales bacterium]|jgi:hypothetical protein
MKKMFISLIALLSFFSVNFVMAEQRKDLLTRECEKFIEKQIEREKKQKEEQQEHSEDDVEDQDEE